MPLLRRSKELNTDLDTLVKGIVNEFHNQNELNLGKENIRRNYN